VRLSPLIWLSEPSSGMGWAGQRLPAWNSTSIRQGRGRNRLDSVELAKAVASAVRALPAAEREVLLLVAWEQLTPAEVAKVLGVPPGTARSRLHRARATVRQALSDRGADRAGVST
jgi:RNA polymerase sigma factor (sigma-70 family)